MAQASLLACEGLSGVCLVPTVASKKMMPKPSSKQGESRERGGSPDVLALRQDPDKPRSRKDEDAPEATHIKKSSKKRRKRVSGAEGPGSAPRRGPRLGSQVCGRAAREQQEQEEEEGFPSSGRRRTAGGGRFWVWGGGSGCPPSLCADMSFAGGLCSARRCWSWSRTVPSRRRARRTSSVSTAWAPSAAATTSRGTSSSTPGRSPLSATCATCASSRSTTWSGTSACTAGRSRTSASAACRASPGQTGCCGTSACAKAAKPRAPTRSSCFKRPPGMPTGNADGSSRGGWFSFLPLLLHHHPHPLPPSLLRFIPGCSPGLLKPTAFGKGAGKAHSQ